MMSEKARLRQVDLLAFGGFTLGLGVALLFFVVGTSLFTDSGFQGALFVLLVIYTGVNLLAGLALLVVYTRRLKDELKKE